MIKRDFQPIYFSIDSKFMRALSNDIRFNHHRRSIFLFFVSFIQNLFFFLGLSIACGDVYRDTHKNFPAGFRIFCSRWMGAGTKPFFFLLYVSYFTVGFKSGGTPTRAHTHRKCVCVCLPPLFFMFSCVAQSFTKLKEENVFFSFSSLSFFFFMICKFVVDFHVLDKLKFKTGWDVLWSRMT